VTYSGNLQKMFEILNYRCLRCLIISIVTHEVIQGSSHLFFPKIFVTSCALEKYVMYSNIVLKHITVNRMIHTGFLLLLVTGSAKCDANTPRASDVMLRKLYEPQK
jgi:hypothetical protein